MRTISLEVDEKFYPEALRLLRLLPENCCHVWEESEELSEEERTAILAIQARLGKGDESDFVDWEEIRDKVDGSLSVESS